MQRKNDGGAEIEVTAAESRPIERRLRLGAKPQAASNSTGRRSVGEGQALVGFRARDLPGQFYDAPHRGSRCSPRGRGLDAQTIESRIGTPARSSGKTRVRA